MSKNVKMTVDGEVKTYNGVSTVQIPTAEGGVAEFKDVDEITIPSGSVTITENGTHDVSAYAQAVVNIDTSDDGTNSLEDFCRNLIEGNVSGDVVLPVGTKIVKASCFYGSSLSSIDLTGIEHIGASAFQYCRNLISVVLPDTLTVIERMAFGQCINLATVSGIPSGIQTLPGEVFSGCSKITTITFKGTPNSIESTAFYNMNGLVTINVPWAEGAVVGAPWGATNATVNYNYTGA